MGETVMEEMSVIERRRAARQKKILENGQNRLNRLYGRPDDAEPTPHTDGESAASALSTSPDHCPDPPDQSIDEVLGQSQPVVPGWPAGMPAPNMEDLFRQMNGQAGAGAAGQSAEDGPAPSVWWRRWDKHRWMIISLLAVLTRLAPMAGVGAALTQNVLVPFFVLETTVYVIRLVSVPLRTNMGLLGTALMMCGISPRALDLWGRYLTFLSQAWSDFMVYMFVIVLSFCCGGGAALAADTGTIASDDGAKVAAPPPPDDHLEFEF